MLKGVDQRREVETYYIRFAVALVDEISGVPNIAVLHRIHGPFLLIGDVSLHDMR